MSLTHLFTPHRALTLTALAAALTSTACASSPAAPTTATAAVTPLAPSCPADTPWDGHSCRASISCPAGSELSGDRCLAKLACPPGSWLQGSSCVAPVRCPDGATRQGERCVAPLSCPKGSVQRGNRCVAPLSCPSGAELQGDRCVAKVEPTKVALQDESGSATHSLHNAIASLRQNEAADSSILASRSLSDAIQLDVFLVSDHTGTRFQIDGFPSGTRTFLLEGGDHVVTFTRPGWPQCSVVLRDTKLGQSITVKDIIAKRNPKGCASVTSFDELGRMAK